jgi:Formate--tetrahydrofolate ligase
VHKIATVPLSVDPEHDRGTANGAHIPTFIRLATADHSSLLVNTRTKCGGLRSAEFHIPTCGVKRNSDTPGENRRISLDTDMPAELELIRSKELAVGADATVISNHWALGGQGAKALAEASLLAKGGRTSKFLHDVNLPIEENDGKWP